MNYISASDVADLHEAVINPNESQGVPCNKSLDAVMARIDNRLTYGMIDDVYEMAACSGCYIAVGHVFNDANKRTAMAAVDISLAINNITLIYDTREAGDMIIRAAQGLVDEQELAAWLRNQDQS